MSVGAGAAVFCPTERLRRIRVLVRRADAAAEGLATAAYVTAVHALLDELVALERIGALDELQRFAEVTWGGRA